MTLKSEYAEGAARDSTLHEDTLAAWKVQTSANRPGSRAAGTPTLTEDQVTVVEQ